MIVRDRFQDRAVGGLGLELRGAGQELPEGERNVLGTVVVSGRGHRVGGPVHLGGRLRDGSFSFRLDHRDSVTFLGHWRRCPPRLSVNLPPHERRIGRLCVPGRSRRWDAGGRVDPEPAFVFEHGLCSEAIAGDLTPETGGSQEITPERFRENPDFVRHLQQVIAEKIYQVDGLQRAGRQQGGGWVYLLDARTPDPQGAVPPADIIGAVEVGNGTLVPGSYRPNAHHRLVTGDGFFRLPPELETALLDAVRVLCQRQD